MVNARTSLALVASQCTRGSKVSVLLAQTNRIKVVSELLAQRLVELQL